MQLESETLAQASALFSRCHNVGCMKRLAMVEPGTVTLVSCCPQVHMRVIAHPGLWQGVIYCNWTMKKEKKHNFFPGQPEAPWGVCILSVLAWAALRSWTLLVRWVNCWPSALSEGINASARAPDRDSAQRGRRDNRGQGVFQENSSNGSPLPPQIGPTSAATQQVTGKQVQGAPRTKGTQWFNLIYTQIQQGQASACVRV